MSNYTDNQAADDPNHVWSKILDLVPRGSEILDIGCSSGNLDKVLIKEKNCIIDGVEPDEVDAKIASKYLRQVWSFSIEDEKNIKKIKEREGMPKCEKNNNLPEHKNKVRICCLIANVIKKTPQHRNSTKK